MNTDFDLGSALSADKKLGIKELLNVMKAQSGGKGTIQALGDKIVLSKLLNNLSIPQMPLLYSAHGKIINADVDKLVSDMEASGDSDAYEIVVKPTHLSSGQGALVLSKSRWDKDGYTAAKLVKHMEHYLGQKAADCESEALKSLVPGFIVQPRYRSTVAFGFPLEMRIVTLWGKARMGIWWWGRKNEKKGRRTTWLVRCPKTTGKLGPDDTWEVLHEHAGDNRGFEVALDLFKDAMSAMSQCAEEIAVAVGAPFLRSDFFVGNAKWGVRLNEVAYGSGVDYKRHRPGTGKRANSSARDEHVDDGPAIAQLLQDGFSHCQRMPPSHFLGSLGAKNADYEAPASPQAPSPEKQLEPHMQVEVVPTNQRCHQLQEDVVRDLVDRYEASSCLDFTPVAAASCETQAAPDPPGRYVLNTVRGVHGGYPQSVIVSGRPGPSVYRSSQPAPVRGSTASSLAYVVPQTPVTFASPVVVRPSLVMAPPQLVSAKTLNSPMQPRRPSVPSRMIPHASVNPTAMHATFPHFHQPWISA